MDSRLILPLLAATMAASAVLVATPAWAQTKVYRCGNEYTNRPAGRSGCTEVRGGNVTIVESARPVAPRTSAPARAPAGKARSSAPRTTSTSDDVVQRRREADARAILEQELRNAQQRQAALEAEYKDGEPDKLGPETHNHQKYLDRVAELKESIERNQADIEGIQRELQRFN